MQNDLDGRPPEELTCPDDQSRRQILKTFGRYAAAAPTAVLLLEPSVAHAGLLRRLLRRRGRRGGYD